MTKFKLNNTYLPLIFIFVSVNALCVIFNDKLDDQDINHLVVQGANLLIFLLMFVSAYLHLKAVQTSNPHAFLRSVLSATVLKLFAIAGATFIYLLAAGERRSTYAVLVGMVLYIIYTAVELRGLFRMNKQQTMSKAEQPMDALAAFLPENTYPYVADYLHRYKVHLTVAKARSSLLGDYRNACKDKHHRISVNGNLNKYAFLITLLHELAHLLTFEQYRHTVAAHGKEWKEMYSNLLSVFLQHNIFPGDIKMALLQSLRNPAASSCAEAHLTRALTNYDKRKPGLFLLEELPQHALFATRDGRQFTKGGKLRKRYHCEEVQTGKVYLFSPVYEVMLVGYTKQ